MILAKLLALIGSVAAAVTLTMLISGVVMWVADLAFGTIAVAPPNNFGLDLLDRYLGTIGLLLFYGTVAFAVAILTRSAAAGMAIPLVFGFFTPFITEIASAVGDGFWDELPNFLRQSGQRGQSDCHECEQSRRQSSPSRCGHFCVLRAVR